MTEQLTTEKLHDPVHQHMRTDFVELRADLTVAQALELILEKQPAGRIIYFYVSDSDGRLQGVIPTRRLLLSARDKHLWEIIVKPVIAIPRSATLLEACEFFILHKLLAFPVVDEERRIIGLVDVELYTRELSDMDQRESHNDLFQLIGVYATEARPRSVFDLFRPRFPWLLATLAGGLVAAYISDAYFHVASRATVVIFIPLVLALASSITAQSVSLAVRSLRSQMPTSVTLLQKIRSELATGTLLGAACGLIAGTAVFIWNGDLVAAFVLAGSIVTSVACAAVLGLTMPYLFRALKRNPQVAAGPVALASADVLTLLLYFNLARWLLG
jgi:magnesium transporter